MTTQQNTSPGRHRAIGVVTAVLGGLVLAGTGGSAALGAVTALTEGPVTHTLDVSGVTDLELDVSRSDLTVLFGDVSEAQLVVSGSRSGEWSLERDEDELVVHTPDRSLSWILGGGPLFTGGWFGDDETAVLTLPRALEQSGIDADISVGAGSVSVTGSFSDLDVEVGAGELTASGSAQKVDASVSTGSATLDLSDVNEGEFSVSVGELTAILTGEAPRELGIDVNVGSATVTVPDVDYAVSGNASLGDVSNGLQVSSRSSRTIVANASVGEINLLAGAR